MAEAQSHKLLVAYDDTAAGRRAAEFAAERAAKTGESVDVVHIGTDITEQEIRDATEDEFIRRNVVVRFDIVNGGGSEDENISVSAALGKLIAQREYQIVIMGNEERGLFHNLMEGSVSNALIEDQTVPVLLVP